MTVRFAASRPFVDPDRAARKLIEIANDVEAVQDGRIYIERDNAPFLAADGTDNFRGRDRARRCPRVVLASRERDVSEVH